MDLVLDLVVNGVLVRSRRSAGARASDANEAGGTNVDVERQCRLDLSHDWCARAQRRASQIVGRALLYLEVPVLGWSA